MRKKEVKVETVSEQAAVMGTEPVAEAPPKAGHKVSEIIANIVLVAALLLGVFAAYSAYTAEVGSGVANIFGFAYVIYLVNFAQI